MALGRRLCHRDKVLPGGSGAWRGPGSREPPGPPPRRAPTACRGDGLKEARPSWQPQRDPPLGGIFSPSNHPGPRPGPVPEPWGDQRSPTRRPEACEGSARGRSHSLSRPRAGPQAERSWEGRRLARGSVGPRDSEPPAAWGCAAAALTTMVPLHSATPVGPSGPGQGLRGPAVASGLGEPCSGKAGSAGETASLAGARLGSRKSRRVGGRETEPGRAGGVGAPPRAPTASSVRRSPPPPHPAPRGHTGGRAHERMDRDDGRSD